MGCPVVAFGERGVVVDRRGESPAGPGHVGRVSARVGAKEDDHSDVHSEYP